MIWRPFNAYRVIGFAVAATVSMTAVAQEEAFTVAGAPTPFHPVFAPEIGHNSPNPAQILSSSLNPDYVTDTLIREKKYAEPIAEPVISTIIATAPEPQVTQAARTEEPVVSLPEPEVTEPRSLPTAETEGSSLKAPETARLPPINDEEPMLGKPETANDHQNSTSEIPDNRLFSSFLSLFSFFNLGSEPEETTVAAPLKQPKTGQTRAEPPLAETTRVNLSEIEKSLTRNETRKTFEPTPTEKSDEKAIYKKERGEPDTRTDTNMQSITTDGRANHPAEDLAARVTYGHTNEGVSIAILDLYPAPVTENKTPAADIHEQEIDPVTENDQAETDTGKLNNPPSSSATNETPAEKNAKPKATITRWVPRTDPNIVDVVTAFFSGASSEGIRVRNNKPGETEPRERESERIQVVQESPRNSGKLVLAVQRSDSEIDSSLEKDSEETLIARIDTRGISTPLVDEQLTSQSPTPRMEDAGFVVDVPVPVSNETRLKEEQLVLGTEGSLGKPIPFADDPGGHCVRRKSGRTWICLETLGWPSVIAEAFAGNDTKNGRTRAIIRYDNDIATQYRVSFPHQSFDRIAAHFEYLLGPPHERPTVMVPIFAEPKKASRVIRWVASDTNDAPQAILEMREIDDVRWSESPDTENGVIRLYRRGMKPVFSMVMTAELTLIDIQHSKTDTPAFVTSP